MRIVRVVPILAVDDIAASAKVYRDVLSMVDVTDLGWLLTLSDPHDVRRQVSLVTQDPTAPCNPAVSIQVADVDAAYAEALESGAQIVYPLTNEPWGSRRFFFSDPAGNIINVLSAA